MARILVFTIPLLIPWQARGAWSRIGLAVYLLGTLVYYAAWLPLIFVPTSAWSNSTAGLLAPRLTPGLSFLGVALIGGSWSYAIMAIFFIALHTWHGFQNL